MMTTKPLTPAQHRVLTMLKDKAWVLLLTLEAFAVPHEDDLVVIPSLIEDGLVLFIDADTARVRGGMVRITAAGVDRQWRTANGRA